MAVSVLVNRVLVASDAVWLVCPDQRMANKESNALRRAGTAGDVGRNSGKGTELRPLPGSRRVTPDRHRPGVLCVPDPAVQTR